MSATWTLWECSVGFLFLLCKARNNKKKKDSTRLGHCVRLDLQNVFSACQGQLKENTTTSSCWVFLAQGQMEEWFSWADASWIKHLTSGQCIGRDSPTWTFMTCRTVLTILLCGEAEPYLMFLLQHKFVSATTVWLFHWHSHFSLSFFFFWSRHYFWFLSLLNKTNLHVIIYLSTIVAGNIW